MLRTQLLWALKSVAVLRAGPSSPGPPKLALAPPALLQSISSCHLCITQPKINAPARDWAPTCAALLVAALARAHFALSTITLWRKYYRTGVERSVSLDMWCASSR